MGMLVVALFATGVASVAWVMITSISSATSSSTSKRRRERFPPADRGSTKTLFPAFQPSACMSEGCLETPRPLLDQVKECRSPACTCSHLSATHERSRKKIDANTNDKAASSHPVHRVVEGELNMPCLPHADTSTAGASFCRNPAGSLTKSATAYVDGTHLAEREIQQRSLVRLCA